MKRLLVIAAFLGLPAGATASDASEKINAIVEIVRSTTATGFADVTIDYENPNLKISGHADSLAHLSRLMRALGDAGGMPPLMEGAHREFRGGRQLTAFSILQSGVGEVRNWSGPINLEFADANRRVEFVPENPLAQYLLKDLEVVGMITRSGQTEAVIHASDNKIFHVHKGERMGRENALIEEIDTITLTLRMSDGKKREMKLAE